MVEKAIIKCNECKHLDIINGRIVYAVCRKTEFVFEKYKTDPKEHVCELWELKATQRNIF